MLSDSPFLFVDVPHGIEDRRETSYFNRAEVKVVGDLISFCLSKFELSVAQNKQDSRIPIQRFTKGSIYVITPYNA